MVSGIFYIFGNHVLACKNQFSCPNCFSAFDWGYLWLLVKSKEPPCKDNINAFMMWHFAVYLKIWFNYIWFNNKIPSVSLLNL